MGRKEEQRKSPSVTWKSVLISLFLIPINIYWMIVSEVGIAEYSLPSFAVPLYPVIFSLFVLILFSSMWKKFFFRAALSQGELLTVYVMLSAACALASIDFMTALVTTLGHPFWFATPENEWENLFWRYLPRWLMVEEKSVLKGYYEGDSTFYIQAHIKAWLAPTLIWCAFTITLIFVMLCINVILRKQWTESERLTYPIVQLCFEMSNRSGLLKNRLMMLGFALSSCIVLINSLNFFYPSLPYIPVKRRGWEGIGHIFTQKPWNAIGHINLSFYPFVIGLGFLMPLDLCFSSWFFFILYKVQRILSSSLGLMSIPSFPFGSEQSFGAAIGLGVFLLLRSRGHLKKALIISLSRSDEEKGEPMRYRWAFIGIAFGIAFLMLFSFFLGMSIWVAIIFFAIYFVLAIVVTRMRAEHGFPVHDFWDMSAYNVMPTIIGTRRLGTNNLVAITLLRWFSHAYTTHPMAHQLEGFKLASRGRMNLRKVSKGMIFATVVGVVAVFGVILHIFYKVGAASGRGGSWTTGSGWNAFNSLRNWLSYPSDSNHFAISFMGIGFIFSLFLMFMRTRFIWWPFHPLGYILQDSWGMHHLWSCMLLGSIAKWLVLKFGGLRSLKRAVPFAFGLILGEFISGGLWSAIGVILGVRTYNFWP